MTFMPVSMGGPDQGTPGSGLSMVESRKVPDDPGPFCMSFGFDLSPLESSLQKVGLLNPPILYEERGGDLHIVTGYRRVLALKRLGWESFPGRILKAPTISPKQAIHVSFYDNLGTRPLNPMEQAMALSRLAAHIDRTALREKYMPMMGLPSHEETLELFLQLEAQLPHGAKLAVAQGRIGLAALKALFALDKNDRETLLKVLAKLKLSHNYQIQFIDILIDLSEIHRIPIARVLEREPVLRLLLEASSETPALSGREILGRLRALRFPRLTRAEEAFNKTVASLRLPPAARVTFPPFFEAPGYRMEIHFQEGKALLKVLRELAAMDALDQIRDPWERPGKEDEAL